MFTQLILNIETVNPEGSKILIVLVVIIGAFLALFFANKGALSKLNFFKKRLQLKLEKNKKYKPDSITITIQNPSQSVVTIDAPIIRFKQFRKTKAYKITAVNQSQIYPLTIDIKGKHIIKVSLIPFYSHEQTLKKYPRLRVELTDQFKRKYTTRYTLLKSTLFKKAN